MAEFYGPCIIHKGPQISARAEMAAGETAATTERRGTEDCGVCHSLHRFQAWWPMAELAKQLTLKVHSNESLCAIPCEIVKSCEVTQRTYLTSNWYRLKDKELLQSYCIFKGMNSMWVMAYQPNTFAFSM